MLPFQTIVLLLVTTASACTQKVGTPDIKHMGTLPTAEAKKHFKGPGFAMILGPSWQTIKPALAFGDTGTVLVVAGPDGCLAAVVRYRSSPVANKQTLVTQRRDKIARFEKRTTLHETYQNAVRYNETTAYRYRLVDRAATSPLDLQGTLLRDGSQVTELLVWSSASGRLARRCHDYVTARFAWFPEHQKGPGASNDAKTGS